MILLLIFLSNQDKINSLLSIQLRQPENQQFHFLCIFFRDIMESIYQYFMVNEDVLTNKAYGDAWSAFYEGAIEPFAIQFSEVLTKMLFTLREQSNGNMVMLTANRLQYMTNKDKLDVSSQLLDRGVMSINDIREIWNLPPVDGGDVRIIRGEYYDANDKLAEDEPEGDNKDETWKYGNSRF